MQQAIPLDDLTDALARGRLAAAEIAALEPRELDAIFEAGAERLESGRYAEAATIFAGLVALFPYAARFWRAWGIALHCLLACERARAAYDAALLLEPGDLRTLCYRGELLLYLGEHAAARRDLEHVAGSRQRELVGRARTLIVHLDRLGGWQPLPPRPPPPDQKLGALELADGRALPLEASRFHDEERLLTPEITRTARLFAPAARGGGTDEVTDTGIIPGRPAALGARADSSAADTPGAADVTNTALVDRRAPPVDVFERGDTAIVRRRLRQPLTTDSSVTDVIPGRGRRR